MRLREVEYDPWTKETRKWYIDDNGDVICERDVDLTTLISYCKDIANQTKGFDSKVKFHHVAIIPPIIQMEILQKHHLDIFSDNPSDMKKVEKIIELEYPALKLTQSKLWRPK